MKCPIDDTPRRDDRDRSADRYSDDRYESHKRRKRRSFLEDLFEFD